MHLAALASGDRQFSSADAMRGAGYAASAGARVLQGAALIGSALRPHGAGRRA